MRLSFRRLTTTLTATTIAAACLAGPVAAAQAQTAPNSPNSPNSMVQLIRLVNGGIAGADCGALGTALRVSGMANQETTRSGLVSNLNKAVGNDAALKLVIGPSVNALGDRALQCGIVKPDPETPLTRIIEMSSKTSSQAGLPELRNILPAVAPSTLVLR